MVRFDINPDYNSFLQKNSKDDILKLDHCN